MEGRTIVCYLSGIWRRLEQLERISGRFPSVDHDQSSRFAGVPNLAGKPLYYIDADIERKPFTQTPIERRAINRPVDHTGET